MNSLRDAQVRHNRSSEPHWDLFSEHRRRVTELLGAGAGDRSGRLCVLGAGNCNDLDLPALRNRYREIHLVDLDGEALTRGVTRQARAADTSIHCHGEIDVSGVLDRLARWSPQSAIGEADLADCVEAPLRAVRPRLPAPFDVAASTCLLSQLMSSVVKAVGERHPRFIPLMQSIRAAHLRLLCDLLAPGGAGILISDVVSSETFPALVNVPANELPATLARLIEQKNFFHGVNPSAIYQSFRTDEFLAARVTAVQSHSPWLWNLGSRVYAVWALTFRRGGE